MIVFMCRVLTSFSFCCRHHILLAAAKTRRKRETKILLVVSWHTHKYLMALDGKNGDYEKTIFNKTKRQQSLPISNFFLDFHSAMFCVFFFSSNTATQSTITLALSRLNVAWNPRRAEQMMIEKCEREAANIAKIELIIFTQNSIEKQP